MRIALTTLLPMDLHSIVGLGVSTESAGPVSIAASAAAPPVTAEKLRFPGEDGGKSLAEMAQRDLYTALQLLAERAQYITGASGAAIALREGTEMVCRASAGSSAPELGAHLQLNSGLSGESVRTRRSLRCDNAETDSRVNRESCRVLGIASVVVMPLTHDGQVNGVFELLSERAYAFEDRDLSALERLAEMVQTALSHAEAARRAQAEIMAQPAQDFNGENSTLEVKAEGNSRARKSAAETGEESAGTQAKMSDYSVSLAQKKTESPASGRNEELPSGEEPPLDLSRAEVGNIRRCEVCGFPVSEGRKLCLDCEIAPNPDQPSPAFLPQMDASEQSWWRSRLYLIGAILVAVLTLGILLFSVR
jgi:putative methionine-R-sulfoxide reductase with GAF domain